MNIFQALRSALLASTALAFCVHGLAQTFPNKPIKIIVGVAPGGLIDVSARLLASSLSPRLGQPIIVDNRPGDSKNGFRDSLCLTPSIEDCGRSSM